MAKLRSNFKKGTITNNPLTDVATTINSAEFAALPVVASPDTLTLILDPLATAGTPEVVYVTAHAASATSVTVTRGMETTYGASAPRQHAVNIPWTHGPTAVDLIPPPSVLDRAWVRGSTAHAFDDEFNDGILDPAWVRVDANATVITYTEGADVLSIKHAGGVADTAGPSHCLIKPLGALTPPVTFEAAFRFFRRYATNYQMFGLIMTSGATTTSAGTWMMPFSSTSTATAWTLSTRSFSALNGAEIANHGDSTFELIGGPLYQRLTWVAANTFRAQWSPDGVSWINLPATDFARTMTPTHVGFAMSTWSTAVTPGPIGTVEYFRVVT